MASFLLFLSTIFCLWIQYAYCQPNVHFYPMSVDNPLDCSGENTIEDLGVDVKWNLNEIYSNEGYTIPDQALGPNKLFRLNVCGGIPALNAACNGTRTWCLEETMLNGTCLTGLANWDSDSDISYYAISNSTNPVLMNILGLRVQITDDDEKIDRDCPNNILTVNYDILCFETETSIRSVREDFDLCQFNFSIHSEAACVDWQPTPQQPVEYHIAGGPESCVGEHSINSIGKSIFWDISMLEVENLEGFEKPDDILNDTLYRIQVCGGLTDENSICENDRQLSLELSTLDKSRCISPLASWDGLSQVSAYVVVNSSGRDNLGVVGFRLQVYDEQTSENLLECGSFDRPTNVNYYILCVPGKVVAEVTSVIANHSNCEYNVTIETVWGCEKLLPIKDDGSIVDNLSAGSVLLILFFVLVFVYIVAGCIYNGCVNGRVGMDAMPNKALWAKICQYTKAGCTTTKDTCCFCGGTGTIYQEL